MKLGSKSELIGPVFLKEENWLAYTYISKEAYFVNFTQNNKSAMSAELTSPI
jgi:hypothetical protein